jgi:sigma-E factor negative regulatory protein RseA
MPYGTEDGTMTTLQEQLSALVDGELPSRDSDRVLVALADEPELRDTWARYQLIGTAIRRGVPDLHDPELAARIATAVAGLEPEGDAAPIPAEVDTPAPGRMRRAASGIAMAASVAALALVGVRYLAPPDAGSGNLPVASVTAPAIQAQPVATGSPSPADIPLDEQRLNDYLQRHNELALGGGLRTLPPYVRVVSTGTPSTRR